MNKGIFKRIIQNFIRLVTLLVAVCVIAYFLIQISPIDPIQAYVGAGVAVSPEQRENIENFWGGNGSPLKQFLTWSRAVLQGDFGVSLIYRRPVLDIIIEKFNHSILLMGLSWVLSGIIGYTLGLLMGINRGKPGERVMKTICLSLSSTPTFWVGLILLLIFSIGLGWFPVGLSVPIGMLTKEITFFQRVYHALLPALALSFTSFSPVALHTRDKVFTAMESDYVLFARARGEKSKEIIKNHVVHNTLIPAITLQFASFSELFGGSVLVEQVFSYPGLGRAAVEAGLRSDVPLLLGVTLFSALFVFLGNSIANILYQWVDPKIGEMDYE
ncbi:ABC transporter permease [Irregularibacter muris]|uniref:ABC transporter permease n=1 Tax=Irregularibacter muris TaxID=1796619 RepID=A0AAE3HF10_9FIRM|nr:ABC transporter permease [Irregularibacter muris]MCR1899391.1 ABC transporter permease [Irregularibacter muris]